MAADVTAAAHASAQRDADEVVGVAAGAEVAFGDSQRARIVLDSYGQTRGFANFRGDLGACPAGQIVGGIGDAAGGGVYPPGGGDAQGGDRHIGLARALLASHGNALQMIEQYLAALGSRRWGYERGG